MPKLKIKLPWKGSSLTESRPAGAEPKVWLPLHSPEKMNAIIRRERARSDRIAAGFSLLVMSAKETRHATAVLNRVAKYLSSRLRLTDELGWLDDYRLCAVLSSTLPTGAWKLAEAIQSECHDGASVDYKVYYYPSDDHFQVEEPSALEHQLRSTVPAEPMEPLLSQPTHGWKRSLDIAGAIIAAKHRTGARRIAAIAVRLTSPGPVLFAQVRSGRGGVPFRMYKFRSMVVDAEAKKKDLLSKNEQDGPAFKIRSDPRITWIGRFLRSTSIDEMPQLWNVLRGEMSLVGPRPLPCDETANCQPWHRQRVDVKPGMTCIWQLRGRSAVAFDDWMRMDISYIRKVSLVGDVKLLVGTVPAVIWHTNGC
jgi:lipopolysaccharide/colanic/teichoic acid biosynthesis glycosyltransferase